MRFLILGPLTVLKDGEDVTPSAPKQRALLALLLANANRPVSMAQVVRELWDYDPPPRAVAAVHTYVMQVRKALRDDDRLVTVEQGYLLRVRPGELDLDAFADAAAAGRERLAAGELAAARRRLRDALGLWRGRVLVDVESGPLLQEAIDRAERDRLDAVAARIEADLGLGRHLELIGELSGLAHLHPDDERLVRLLMRALYRAGRQADAIAAYGDLRRELAREHRAAPAPETERLYTHILTGHPGLEWTAPPVPRPRSSADHGALL
ncbi:AfsR/SARP family transcriptional regulator [Actinokineospora fastidiosa]|uniref:OmpR/PhoB-type domain-containing protein n=1 Tax=Actinokineospora fastidiosa TaxID=1816 RepID=A0A918GSG3_9PSEU|nr:AfsR/SARP family transcriptional regulator [Actinokineospora fastidiosa]GGS58040.1 hypothetical protein GCM10010171_61370 [Actinokineospora fastidiosa]